MQASPHSGTFQRQQSEESQRNATARPENLANTQEPGNNKFRSDPRHSPRPRRSASTTWHPEKTRASKQDLWDATSRNVICPQCGSRTTWTSNTVSHVPSCPLCRKSQMSHNSGKVRNVEDWRFKKANFSDVAGWESLASSPSGVQGFPNEQISVSGAAMKRKGLKASKAAKAPKHTADASHAPTSSSRSSEQTHLDAVLEPQVALRLYTSANQKFAALAT